VDATAAEPGHSSLPTTRSNPANAWSKDAAETRGGSVNFTELALPVRQPRPEDAA
jgi:hypothetical protein